MSLPALAIKRPITTVMATLVVVFLGAISLLGIPSDLLPEMAFPVVVVITNYSGAGPHEVESLVTRPVEEAVSIVGGVRRVLSQSSEGISVVSVEFGWGSNMDMMALEVRESVDMVRDYLPADVTTPRVLKADPSLLPVMQLALSGPYGMVEMTHLANQVKSSLERIEGVASVSVGGGQVEEVAVEVDPLRLVPYGLGFTHLITALRQENLSLPGGHLDEAGQRVTIRTVGDFLDLDDIRDFRLQSPTGASIPLREVAEVNLRASAQAGLTRVDGQPAVTMSLQTQSGVNTVQVAARAHQVLEGIREDLPPGVNLTVVQDQSDFVNRSIATVVRNVLLGGILAVGILYLFLLDLRTVAVIAVAMPVSVVSTFAFMFFTGLTLNLMSLGGLALGVGMLVDNAIVILENIFRHREEGSDPTRAALEGTQEVATAVTASTLTTMAVFLPVVFITGLASQIFRELALTVSFSLASSLLVSLTFIPMAAAVILTQPVDSSNRLVVRARGMQSALARSYSGWIGGVLEHRARVLAGVGVVVLLALGLLLLLPRQFLPDMDQREIVVEATLPQGTSLEESDRVMREVESLVAAREDVFFRFASVGWDPSPLGPDRGVSDRASLRVRLVSHQRRLPETAEVMEQLRRDLEAVPGAEFRVRMASSIAGEQQVFGAPIVVSVQGDDLEVLGEISSQIVQQMEGVSGIVDVEDATAQGSPEARLVVDRQRAAQYGLSSAQVAMMVRIAVEGEVATRLTWGGQEIDLLVLASPDRRARLSDVTEMVVLTPSGAPVSLSQVVNLEMEPGPVAITRRDQVRIAQVMAEVSGRDLGSATSEVREAVARIDLPPGYHTEMGGETREMMEAFGTLGQALAIGCILVYMVLASQFESFTQPFVMMTTVPLAFTGVVAGLFIWGHPLSVPSVVGVIAMVGIVVNNGIVLISYINQLRSRGMEGRQAILEATRIRLRPILMTSLTTVMGLAPMAFGTGAGNELQASLAVAVLGGIVTSTFLTLFVAPVLYSYLERIDIGKKGKEEGS